MKKYLLALVGLLFATAAQAQSSFPAFQFPIANNDIVYQDPRGALGDTNIPLSALASLPNVKTYGASGSGQSTTGTISASSANLALAAAQDFVNGQGILVMHAGAATTVGAPTLSSVTPTNRTGSTTYAYTLASVDSSGGVSAVSSTVSTATGATTLGFNQVSDLLGPAAIQVNWTVGSGSPLCTAVWRNRASAGNVFLGCFQGNNVLDMGLPTVTSTWIPATPPGGALADWLPTTITSGGGTTALVLGATATTAASAVSVLHDDTTAITNALAANSSLVFPCGTYNERAIAVGTGVRAIRGAGVDCTIVNGLTPANNSLNGGLSVSSGNASFTLTDMTINAVPPMAFGALSINQASPAFIARNNVNGMNGIEIQSSSNADVGDNLVSGYWNIGLWNLNSTGSSFHDNHITAISGAAVAAAMSTGGSGAYNFATALEAYGGSFTSFTGNLVQPFGGIFGINVQDANVLVSGNVFQYTGRECMSVGGPATAVKVIGNNCFWVQTSPANEASFDFGMSISDNGTNALSDVDVADNTFVFSNFSSIAVAGTGAGAGITGVSIHDNHIYNPISAVSTFTCAIQVMGSNVSNVNVNNNSVYPFLMHATYLACENNAFGTGNPNSDKFGLQIGPPGSSGTVSIVGLNSLYYTRPVQVNGPASY